MKTLQVKTAYKINVRFEFYVADNAFLHYVAVKNQNLSQVTIARSAVLNTTWRHIFGVMVTGIS